MTESLAEDPFIGRTIDERYQILSRIGEGGMGVVYKAKQLSIDRVIAIKMLNRRMATDPTWVQRFNMEAKACSRLRHPNTIRLFDFGQTREGLLFMAMEFLEGKSLRQTIADDAPMDPMRVIRIIAQCCTSLIEAHGMGIIHRDIKPDNVFVLDLAGSPDFVKVLDFSVAKLLMGNEGLRTQAGIVFGTPQYMSPEQGRGAKLDVRSDIYALGVLAYEMICGRPPFTDPNPMSVLHMHMHHPVPPLDPNLSPTVRDFIIRCLAKEPAHRDASAQDLLDHANHVLASLGERPSGLIPSDIPGIIQEDHSSPNKIFTAGPQQKTMIAGQHLRAPSPAPSEQQTILADAHPSPSAAAASEQNTILAKGSSQTVLLDSSEGIVSFSQDQRAHNGTMLLDDSEGVVSFAQRGDTAKPAAIEQTPSAPSLLFWLSCILTGVGVGVVAYIIVITLGAR